MYHTGRGAELLDYFQSARALVEDPERVESRGGRVEYVTRPIRPPSFAAWAASIGVAPGTVSRWVREHQEFAAAAAQARGILEGILLELASVGAIDHRWAQFLLRCNHGYGYADHLEVKAGLTIEPIRRDCRDELDEPDEREVGEVGASSTTPVAVLKRGGRPVALLDSQDLGC